MMATSTFQLLGIADTRCLLLLKFARHSSNLPLPSSKANSVPTRLQPKKPPVPQLKIKRFPIEYHGVVPTTFKDETLWLPIYRFPFVDGCKKIIRCKSYFTLFSMGQCAYKLYEYLLVNPNVSFTNASLIFTISLGSLLFVGNFSRRLICQIYTSEDLQYLRFSRFTFFGFRRDLVLPVNSVMPLTETNVAVTTSFLNVTFIKPEQLDLEYDNEEFYDKPLRVCLRFGGLLDEQRFEQTLGKILARRF